MSTPCVSVWERADASKADLMREDYGKVKWLLSWYLQDNGMWLARVSCPKLPDTHEAISSTRVDAINLATRALLDAIQAEVSTRSKCAYCEGTGYAE